VHKFKDLKKRDWTLDLTFGTYLRVKAASGGKFVLIDPESLIDGRGLGSILTCEKPTDYDLLWEVLWHLIEPQAIELGITAEEFGQAMAADCLVDAKLIFLEEWRDFFRRLQRPDQAAALEKILQYQAKHLEIVQARLASPEMEEIDDRVQRALQKKANASFTSLRDSLDKVLSDSPGDSST
jgi:hypothetical protein